MYKGLPVANYALGPTKNVAQVKVDRSQEGIVLSVALDEYLMPSVWAEAVVGSNSHHYLANVDVESVITDTTKFVTDGTNYWAKTITLDTGTTLKTLNATVNGSTVTYTDGTVTLPDANLTAANQSWYWTQMSAGNYGVSGLSTAPDFSLGTDGAAAFSGASVANRWLRSNNDSTWKAGRDAMAQFLVGKSLAGVSQWTVDTNGGYWATGGDTTTVAAAWPFDSYFAMAKTAYVNTGAVDATAAASAAE
jgi:hypothetical protein